MFKALTFKLALNIVFWAINKYEDQVMDRLRIDGILRQLVDDATDALWGLVTKRIQRLSDINDLEDEYRKTRALYISTLNEAKRIAKRDDMYDPKVDEEVIFEIKPVKYDHYLSRYVDYEEEDPR